MNSTENVELPFSPEQGETLVKLARKTIMEELGKSIPREEASELDAALQSEELSSRHGTFVTLKIKGNLRGCIGSLEASESVVDGVKKNAVNAAFHDPRFPRLKEEELNKIDIEVSVLTDPKPLQYREGKELPSLLRPGIDGVIIRKGPLSATFLPQVWAQLPKCEDFLSRLCLKAGLSAHEWQEGELEVFVYQVVHFNEE